MNNDEALARILQDEWNFNNSAFNSNNQEISRSANNKNMKMGDPSWDLIDPNPDAYALFLEFDREFFWNKLVGVEIKWSNRMTLCAGVCSYEGRGGLCSVRLSKPLLQLRPRKDLLETLLHEMIHAYLFVTDNNRDRDGHGPEFHSHMNRINQKTGLNISVYHSFHDEVDSLRVHWWRCNGPCQNRKPFYGYVKRSINRPPSANDNWWNDHKSSCDGAFIKIKQPNDMKKETNIRSISQSSNESIKSTDLKKASTSAMNNSSSIPASNAINERANKMKKSITSSPDIRQAILQARNKFLDKLGTNILSNSIKDSIPSKNCYSHVNSKNKEPTDIKYWLCNPSYPIGQTVCVNFTSCANQIHRKKNKNVTTPLHNTTNGENSNKGETLLNYVKSESDYIRSKTGVIKKETFEISVKRLNNENGDYSNLKKIKLDSNFYKDSNFKTANNDMTSQKDEWAMMSSIVDVDDNEPLCAALKNSLDDSYKSSTYGPSVKYIPGNTDNSMEIIASNDNKINSQSSIQRVNLEEEIVSCPVCGINLKLSLVNAHLDTCLS